ncbi:uncharacterized protein J3D65DRAFT_322415 [Phyllosticta citribraziliensis]|uniref:Uncharacterized protein n=1 Tax=Phyllosticta citribraziliensis TaxID=989973 RepID=A0ABR1LSY5_9PEZI
MTSPSLPPSSSGSSGFTAASSSAPAKQAEAKEEVDLTTNDSKFSIPSKNIQPLKGPADWVTFKMMVEMRLGPFHCAHLLKDEPKNATDHEKDAYIVCWFTMIITLPIMIALQGHTGSARSIWRKLCDMYDAKGILSEADVIKDFIFCRRGDFATAKEFCDALTTFPSGVRLSARIGATRRRRPSLRISSTLQPTRSNALVRMVPQLSLFAPVSSPPSSPSPTVPPAITAERRGISRPSVAIFTSNTVPPIGSQYQGYSTYQTIESPNRRRRRQRQQRQQPTLQRKAQTTSPPCAYIQLRQRMNGSLTPGLTPTARRIQPS